MFVLGERSPVSVVRCGSFFSEVSEWEVTFPSIPFPFLNSPLLFLFVLSVNSFQMSNAKKAKRVKFSPSNSFLFPELKTCPSNVVPPRFQILKSHVCLTPLSSTSFHPPSICSISMEYRGDRPVRFNLFQDILQDQILSNPCASYQLNLTIKCISKPISILSVVHRVSRLCLSRFIASVL